MFLVNGRVKKIHLEMLCKLNLGKNIKKILGWSILCVVHYLLLGVTDYSLCIDSYSYNHSFLFQLFVPKVAVMYVLGILAFVFYITKMPERCFPGMFCGVRGIH